MSLKPKVFDVIQDTSGHYSAVIVDEDDAVVPATDLTAVTLTLYDTASGDIINDRFEQDALNVNDVTIDSEGNLVWAFTSDDMPRLHTDRVAELHTALWKLTWNSGASQLYHEVNFRVNKVRFPDAP